MDEFEVQVRLFGAVEVENQYGRIQENRSRTSHPWELLKYLLVNRGREVDQAELRDVLWQSGEEGNTDVALRVRLRRLREALAPLGLDGTKGLVLYSQGKYLLNPQYTVTTDEQRYLELVEQIQTLPLEDPQGLALCIEALELQRGEYMAFPADAPWLAGFRAYYRKEFLSLAQTALNRMKLLGDAQAASLLCSRAVTLAPEAEDLHKALVSYLVKERKELDLLRYISALTRTSNAAWLSELEG